MERAPLRPVPSRPPSPVDPAEAIRHVTAELSPLDAPAAEALALVTLAGRSRDEVAVQAGLPGEPLAEALARARKALRRRLHPLPGSGWCERAERLLSDRLDGALEDPGPARLEVHLANCPRCVEHERRLAQAQDALVAGFMESTTAPPPAAEPEPESAAADERETPDGPAAALRIVEDARAAGRAADAVEGDAPTALPPAEDAPALPEADEPRVLSEADEPSALPEADEPPAVPRAEEPPAVEEGEPSPALEEAEEPPALADVVPMPVQPQPSPSFAPARAFQRDEPLPAPRPYAPLRAVPAEPPRGSDSPPPARSRLAATYAPPARSEGSERLASDDTWATVAPLLVIFGLAVATLALVLLIVDL